MREAKQLELQSQHKILLSKQEEQRKLRELDLQRMQNEQIEKKRFVLILLILLALRGLIIMNSLTNQSLIRLIQGSDVIWRGNLISSSDNSGW